MFETYSIESLQQYWWIIISLLGAVLVFLMFVQGGQTFIFSIGNDDSERTLIVNSVGRKWDLAFTTLVTFGGALFASFPVFYAVSFSGAYWLWSIILITFVVQAVSFEFRSKPKNFLGKKVFDIFLAINGFLGPFLIGVVVGTFFTGAEFSVDRMRFLSGSDNIIAQWHHPLHGLEALFVPFNLVCGLTVLFIARVLALLYFINSINDSTLFEKVLCRLKYNFFILFILVVLFLIFLFTMKGVSFNNNEAYSEQHKYLHNFLQMPWMFILFVVGLLNIVGGIVVTLIKKVRWGIWAAGSGVIKLVFSLFVISAFNNTAYYPSLYDITHSLGLHNSSSSHYTLTVMSYVSLIVPFVMLYIIYAWRSISNKMIDRTELDEAEHKY